jgi:outer membrane immunogenic protein
MKKILLGALLASIVLAATPGNAADLPRGRSAPPPESYAPPPVFGWQGLYIGVNGGYGFGAFQEDGHDFIGSPNGGVIGVTAGYNFMVAPRILLGIEGDFDFTGMKVSRMPHFGVSTQGEVDHMLTVRARAGYTMDRALIYVTGGFAGSDNTVGVSNIFGGGFYGRQTTFQTGWALGAGLAFMLTNNISAKGEYLFTSVGNDRFFDYSAAALHTGVNTSTVKGGLNFHF